MTEDFGLEGIFSDASDLSPARLNAVLNDAAAPGLGRRSSQRPLARSQSFRQTNLFGQTLRGDDQRQSQTANSRWFRVDMPPEIPTHHGLNPEALKTWVYPLNLGPIRDYQFSIVKSGLFNNTLVALPTGLGKTFIAATIMLNFYRWTHNAKIVFVAPTKPLVSQQVEACLSIAGIPRSKTTLLTGETPPVLREAEWETKRLFFMTPQTLMNDLSKGYADPKSIVLLVIDEAHRATGDYAYVKVAEFLRRFSKSFRVLALTATPGAKVESVQAVIDNLGISHTEIRTEESIDIRQYVHARKLDVVTLDPSDEIIRVQELFSKALKPFVDKLSQQNIYWGRDPMSLTTYGLLKAREEWAKGAGRHVNQGLKFALGAIFGMLQTLAHSIKLLHFHGIKPFYNNLVDFRSSVEDKGEKGPKLKNQLLKDPNFQEMMNMIEKWLKLDGFVGHPKMTYLCDTLLNHFMDAGQGSNTRAIVFNEYRDSAEEIVRALNAHKPMISAAVFVGQADSKRSEGMKQKQQIETIERFKNGGFNVLVATSIGEEGLDIGQVDLIVCYDASASPIRMLQRMGRTGRKRAGNVVLLLMKGKEEDQFAKAKDNYEKMQKLISEGSEFQYRHDLASRIVPPDIRPEVDKRLVDIPVENTQDNSLPEPKKTAAALRKKPAKKIFNMPDGVETGFMKVSDFLQPSRRGKGSKKPGPVVIEPLADIPDLNSVCLSRGQATELATVYKYVPYLGMKSEDVALPDITQYPIAQRRLRPSAMLRHGAHTKRCVRLFRVLGNSQDKGDRYLQPYGQHDQSEWRKLPVLPFAADTDQEEPGGESRPKVEMIASSKKPRAQSKKQVSSFMESGDEVEEDEDKDETTEEGDVVISLAPARQRGRGGRAAAVRTRSRKAQRGRTRLKKTGDHIDDLGDDCERTSDINDTDGSDSGADLADFIVGDDELISSIRSPRSTGSRTWSPSSRQCSSRTKAARSAGAKHGKGNSFLDPMEITQTQESNGSLPDIDELFTMSTAAKRDGTRRPSMTDADQGVVRKTSTRTKRRRVLADSEDDE